MFFSSFAIKSGCTSKDFKTVVIRGFPPEKGTKKIWNSKFEIEDKGCSDWRFRRFGYNVLQSLKQIPFRYSYSYGLQISRNWTCCLEEFVRM